MASSSSVARMQSAPMKLSSKDDYESWRELMLGLLESMSSVDGKNPPPVPETDPQAYEDWRRIDRSVKDWIVESLCDELVPTVVGSETSREVWLQLQTVFTQLIPTGTGLNEGGYKRMPAALYKAALRGDWEATKAILDQYSDAAEARIAPTLNAVVQRRSSYRKGNPVPAKSDVALYLVDKYPALARLRDFHDSDSYFKLPSATDINIHSHSRVDTGPTSGLVILAGMSRSFPNGESCGFWHNFIYKMSHKLRAVMSEAVQNLVPCVESIGRKKLKHHQALELVKSLCQKIESMPHEQASAMYEESIILAAKNGIHQVVREILEISPTSVIGSNIFSIAALERHENVFNLLYDMSDRKFNFYDSVDNLGNNLLHLCAYIAPTHKLDLVPGPALQMQRELQWFQEVEKLIHPSRREWPNNNEKIPRVLFSETHKDLKTNGEEWMRSTANSSSVAAALVATIMFAAAFTVPGGLNSDSGNPVFRDKLPFLIFIVSDAVSLFTSLTSLLMFLSILTSRYAEQDFLYVLPKRSSIGLLVLFASITFMMVAFGAALYLMLVEKHAWLLIPVAALAFLPIGSFVLLQFPLLLAVVSSTYGPSIFGKKTGKLLY